MFFLWVLKSIRRSCIHTSEHYRHGCRLKSLKRHRALGGRSRACAERLRGARPVSPRLDQVRPGVPEVRRGAQDPARGGGPVPRRLGEDEPPCLPRQQHVLRVGVCAEKSDKPARHLRRLRWRQQHVPGVQQDRRDPSRRSITRRWTHHRRL